MTDSEAAWGIAGVVFSIVVGVLVQQRNAQAAPAPAPAGTPAQVPSDVWDWPDWMTTTGTGPAPEDTGNVRNLWPGPAPENPEGENALSREDVAVYQRALAELGLYEGAFDGRVEATRTAIQGFQEYYLAPNADIQFTRLDYPTQQAINQAWRQLYGTGQSEEYVPQYAGEVSGWTP